MKSAYRKLVLGSVMALAAVSMSASAYSESSFYYRTSKTGLIDRPSNLPPVDTGEGGSGDTGGDSGGGESQNLDIAIQVPSPFGLTVGSFMELPLLKIGDVSGVSYRAGPDAYMPGLVVGASGAVSGLPTAAADTEYRIEVEAYKGETVLAVDSVSKTLRAPLVIDGIPDDISYSILDPFPTTGITATTHGGDSASLQWSMNGAPDWLDVVSGTPGTAHLAVKEGHEAAYTSVRSIFLSAVDGEGRTASSPSFSFEALEALSCETGPVGTACPDGAIYVGDNPVTGIRIYAATEDEPGTFYVTDGVYGVPTSQDDGEPNTTAMANLSPPSRFPAANQCRLRGSVWYLPAIKELETAFRSGVGNFMGSGRYWSSTSTTTVNYYSIIAASGTTQAIGPSKYYVRCVRH